MRNWSIKTRVLLLALLPTVLLAVLLGSYFTYLHFQQLETQLQKMGEFVTYEMSSQVKYGLITGDKTSLQNLVNATVGTSDIVSAAVFDQSGTILAYAGPDGFEESLVKATFSQQLAKMNNVDYSFFKLPVNLEKNDIEYFRNQSAENFSDYYKQLEPNKRIGWVAVNFERSHIRLAQYQTVMVSVAMIAFSLAICILLALFLSLDITRPLLALNRVVSRLKSGDLNTRITMQVGGELGNLAAGINEMAGSLKTAQDELQQSIEQATKDLTESLEMVEIQNVELDIARKEALEASRVKSEFIANISHEIRTPMNSVIGFTNLLLESDLTSYQKDYLVTIKKSAGNLLDIINDILDFSKIEAGKLSLHYIPMDINECVEDVLTLLAPNAHAKHIELVSRIESNVPHQLIGDPLRIKQVITNLIGNAIKFTESGSVEIVVSIDKETEQNYDIRVGVTDTGLGLSSQEQKQLFRAFGQVDTTVRRKYGGTGLGLVISKKLINQMGGTIGVSSEPGQGSTFWFTFISEKATLVPAQLLEYHRLAGYSIALIEPQLNTNVALTSLLTQWKANVLSYNHPQELYEVMDSDPNFYVDVILLSTNQVTDEFFATVETLVTKNKNRIIALINSSDQDIFQRLNQYGIHLCFSKPISARKLYDELCKLLLLKSTTPLVETVKASPMPSLIAPYTQIKPLRILAVDDNPSNLKLLAALLERRGISVTQANSGARALALASQQLFHLIFMDIQMPNMDGIEVTQRLRKPNHLNSTTPIIAVSAHVLGYEKDALLAAGINDYIIKPINTEMLDVILVKWLKEAATAKSLQFDSVSNANKKSDVVMKEDSLPIDLELGIKLAGGKADLAKELLDMLLKSLPETRKLIERSYQEKNFNELQHHVHKLHGGACYCGVPRLKLAANQLETAVKTSNLMRINPLYEVILVEIDAVLLAAEII